MTKITDTPKPEAAADPAVGVDALVITNDTLRAYTDRLNKYIEIENPEHYPAKTVLRDLVFLLGLSIDRERFNGHRGFNEFADKYKAEVSL